MTDDEGKIINLNDERLIREGEAAVDIYNKDTRSARRQIMPMARGLLAARLLYPADKDFGDWLHTSPYREIDKDDRAALIKIGENDAFAAKFVRSTILVSPRTIWEAIRELLPVSHDAKPTPGSGPSLKLVELTAPTAPDEKPAATEPAEEIPPAPTIEPIAAELPEAPEPAKKRAAVGRRPAYAEAPRAAEVAAIFENEKARTTLSTIWQTPGGKAAWALILEAIDGGVLKTNNRTIAQPNLRLLFPDAPQRLSNEYMLDNPKHRPIIRDIVLPAILENLDQIRADPKCLAGVIARYQRRKLQIEQTTKVRERALSELPSAELELVVYGVTVWPRLDDRQGIYDYDQVRAAIWTFRDLDNWNKITTDNSPGSKAIRIRCSLRYFGEYLMRNDRTNRMQAVFNLILWFAHLMEKAPDAECKWPPYPHIEGQW